MNKMEFIDQYKIRPLQAQDLDLVLNWRNSDRIRETSHKKNIISKIEHQKWFQSLENNPHKSAYIFEWKNQPAGLIQFFDRTDSKKQISWGFYLGKEGLPKGTGTMMGVLALDLAFRDLQVEFVIGEALINNQISHRYHEKLGFKKLDEVDSHSSGEDSKNSEFFIYRLSSGDWRQVRSHLLSQASEFQVPQLPVKELQS